MTLLDTQLIDGTASENFKLAIDDNPEFILSPMRCNDGNGTLSYLFFSEEFVDMARAKAICARCSSKAECLAGALVRSEPWGVWGGALIAEGRSRTTKRPRGRPVTKSQAVLTITEVPLPGHWVA
ncbi:MAG: WhiB family transcriptional regulator [Actinomycetota bacterium]